MTHDVHYENFRSERLAKGGGAGGREKHFHPLDYPDFPQVQLCHPMVVERLARRLVQSRSVGIAFNHLLFPGDERQDVGGEGRGAEEDAGDVGADAGGQWHMTTRNRPFSRTLNHLCVS